MVTTGSSNKTAKGIVILNTNEKYLSAVKLVMNIPCPIQSKIEEWSGR